MTRVTVPCKQWRLVTESEASEEDLVKTCLSLESDDQSEGDKKPDKSLQGQFHHALVFPPGPLGPF